jgi:hypothetical protein
MRIKNVPQGGVVLDSNKNTNLVSKEHHIRLISFNIIRQLETSDIWISTVNKGISQSTDTLIEDYCDLMLQDVPLKSEIEQYCKEHTIELVDYVRLARRKGM